MTERLRAQPHIYTLGVVGREVAEQPAVFVPVIVHEYNFFGSSKLTMICPPFSDRVIELVNPEYGEFLAVSVVIGTSLVEVYLTTTLPVV